jgi:hypothetical protein
MVLAAAMEMEMEMVMVAEVEAHPQLYALLEAMEVAVLHLLTMHALIQQAWMTLMMLHSKVLGTFWLLIREEIY